WSIVRYSDYTWVNISVTEDLLSDEHPYIVYVYDSDQLRPGVNPTDSYLLSHNRPYVFINNLVANTEITLLVCDTRTFDYSSTRQRGYIVETDKLDYLKFLYGDKSFTLASSSALSESFDWDGGKMDWRFFACERDTYLTKDDIVIKDLSIEIQHAPTKNDPILILTWKPPESLQRPSDQTRIRYVVEIFRNGQSIWSDTFNPNRTFMDFKIASVEATYRALVTLEANGIDLFTVNSKSVFIDKDEVSAGISKLLIAVAGFILISLLIICLLLQLLIFTTRRYSNNKNNYPPPHVSVGRSDSMSLNTINPTPLSVVVASTSNLDGGDLGQTVAVRFMEPEAELLPFYKKQNKTWRDLLGALEVRSIPVQTLDTMKLFDIHKELARGQIGVCKVRSKDSNELQYDFKFCPHADGESITQMSLVIEAAILAQLKHIHVVLMHGIVEYSTINKSTNLALLLEDCGSITLREYCINKFSPISASNYALDCLENTGGDISPTSLREEPNQLDVIEVLQHLRGIVSALEHFAQLQYVHK
ncbi:uncharacterized protein LOC142356546, partial [Convolutriloba macropyga]|uniref:uncharacterized protein LOC142356546 n=1 Tax=Convolutriloba macropyga TaxID=536237 RepID=UPI003F5201A0